MITVPAVNDGGYKPASSEPDDVLEMVCNSSSYRYTTLEDFQTPVAADLNQMPKRVVSVVAENFTFPEKFFGMHFNRYPGTTSPKTPLSYSTVRSHDGGLRWQQIETSKGVFNWSYFDSWMTTHSGKDIIFTVFGTPAWASARPSEASAYNINGLVAEPANMQDLADFVDALMVRAAGRIQYFEVYNEPQSTGFWTGTQAKLAEMTRIVAQRVKAAMPSAKIICSPVTGWSPTAGGVSENYFLGYLNASDGSAGTAKDWIDIVGVHLYCPGGSTRNLPGMIDRIKAAMTTLGISSKPIWDTESGILSPDFIDIPAQRRRDLFYAQAVLSAAKGIERSCWYTYDHSTMGFLNDDEFRMWRETVVARLAGKTVSIVVSCYSDVYAVVQD